MMRTIQIFIDHLLVVSGFHGSEVPVLRHVLLILVAALLSVLSYLFFRVVLVPLITRMTRDRSLTYANVIFERPVLLAFCGIVPAVVAAVGEHIGAKREDYTRALFTAGAIGHVVAENACIAGAVGGCQAECGTAAGMAAAAAIDLLGGTTEQMKNAIALALKNLLGLACDPVAGLVEVPCVKRNGFEAVHTLVAVEMAMAGIQSQIPVDEVIQAMDEIGKLMPASIRETSLAGLAMTETGQKIAQQMSENHK